MSKAYELTRRYDPFGSTSPAPTFDARCPSTRRCPLDAGYCRTRPRWGGYRAPPSGDDVAG